MQNMDLYTGRHNAAMPPQYDRTDPEFFTRAVEAPEIQSRHHQKKASRLLFVVAAFSIISFTTGLVLGLKFAGGQQREIVDHDTFQAMTTIGNRVRTMVQEESDAPAETPAEEETSVTDEQKSQSADTMYPRDEYPYVLTLSGTYGRDKAGEMAKFLSTRGFTVILSRSDDNFRVFIGPYKSHDDAKNSLQKVSSYKEYSLASKVRIVKR